MNKVLVLSAHPDDLEISCGGTVAKFVDEGNKVDNIIATIDFNGQQIDGPVDEINSLLDLKDKLQSFGWKVYESDGNDFESLSSTLEKARKNLFNGFPIINIMKTVMGKGVDFMENSHKWHGIPPNDEQLNDALNQNKETLGDY